MNNDKIIVRWDDDPGTPGWCFIVQTDAMWNEGVCPEHFKETGQRGLGSDRLETLARAYGKYVGVENWSTIPVEIER